MRRSRLSCCACLASLWARTNARTVKGRPSIPQPRDPLRFQLGPGQRPHRHYAAPEPHAEGLTEIRLEALGRGSRALDLDHESDLVHLALAPVLDQELGHE